LASCIVLSINHKHATIFIFAYLYIVINQSSTQNVISDIKTQNRRKIQQFKRVKPQFSINGTLRSGGSGGPPSPALSENRYERKRALRDVGVLDVPSSAAIVSGIYNYNDSSAVKASSLSRGMMSTKYRWAKRDTLRLHETRKRKQPSFANRKTEIVKQKTNTCIDAANAEYYVNGVYVTPGVLPPRLHREPDLQNLAGSPTTTTMRKVTASALHREPASSIAAKSQSDHIANLKRKCESNNAVNLLAQSLGSNVYTK
jgi:hypothetical protein